MHDAAVAVRKIDLAFRATGTAIEIVLPSGEVVPLGEGGPSARMSLHTANALASLSTLDENSLVACYLNGEIDIAGSFSDVMNLKPLVKRSYGLTWVRRFLVPLVRGQKFTNRAAIGRHYELDPQFYLSFLDSLWPAYSQGIHASPGESLSAAIERKFQYATTACRIGPDSEVLEVGPGWGAYLKYLLPLGARLTALTNSSQMKTYLSNLFRHPNVTIQEGDFLSYQQKRTRFSALTMMGVLEHLPDYRRVCRQFREILKPGGRVYLDASAAREKYKMSPFIYNHVFPYNHSFVHLKGFLSAAKREGLSLLELHDDSENYRQTMIAWAANLDRHYDALEKVYGAYHARRFRLYLWGGVHAFEQGDLQCHRLVLQTPGA